ncbi:MAG: Zn-dependent hydrolase [Rhodospirillaceae bacterium]|nr:Zn-dependent hydrolase [Rhodospirillaceae bacterium]
MISKNLRVDGHRLVGRIEELAQIGGLEGGGVCRLAFSDEDKQAREKVVRWMTDLGLDIVIDRFGNTVGIRAGQEEGPPVMMGSHIDTVETGGSYDGALGVLAGLEVIETLNDANIGTRYPIAVAFFSNEEGCRFQPDMMGSCVFTGVLSHEEASKAVAPDGTTIADELERREIGGSANPGDLKARAFLELHVEQGPIMEAENLQIGVVEGVQGISWSEINLKGVSNHAGTTPMHLRHDAGFVAAEIATYVRKLARDIGGGQVATVGVIELHPSQINVVADQAKMTVDLRNLDENLLLQAEHKLEQYAAQSAKNEGVDIEISRLARFQPTPFDTGVINLVAKTAENMGFGIKRMSSGAGHDAQILAPSCPTGMIFVPSRGGKSHNIEEYTDPDEIAAGANVLLGVALELAE